ncbi:C2H2-like zinc finger protein [Raphanus sativus]|nr:C2H2-like zinc finger protein [Raphanus sativus]
MAGLCVFFKKVLNNPIQNLCSSSASEIDQDIRTRGAAKDDLYCEGSGLKTDKVAVDDQLRSTNDADSYISDSDYFMNCPKKSDSDVSVDMSLRNTGLNRFNNGDELEVKEGESKYELRKSKSVLSSYESDLVQMQTSRFIGPVIANPQWLRNQMVQTKTAKVTSLQYVFKVFKSGQTLGGHKRSHSFESQEHMINTKQQHDI